MGSTANMSNFRSPVRRRNQKLKLTLRHRLKLLSFWKVKPDLLIFGVG